VHSSDLVNVREVNRLSVLYRVRGSEAGKLPYLLTAHLDVVPAEPDKWTQPPFSGNVVDGFVYGRGAIDDKSSVMARTLSLS
jgi:carboxypeptidase PM20D1